MIMWGAGVKRGGRKRNNARVSVRCIFVVSFQKKKLIIILTVSKVKSMIDWLEFGGRCFGI